MDDISKLMLSAEELELVKNSDWILTKRKIMDKVNLILGDLSARQKRILEGARAWLPAEVLESSAKISKGENYLQLPYMLLDHPRIFGAADIFAIRTMFWWGNFFSITLHLSGKYKKHFEERIMRAAQFEKTGFFICLHEEQWHHHFEADNYVLARDLSNEQAGQLLNNRSFLKIAKKFNLQDWETMPAKLEACYREMIELLGDQLPSR